MVTGVGSIHSPYRPNLQRSGIGTALINHAEAALESKGYMKINLQIMEGNAKNQAFYETVGYTR